jgi:hypothetical protein
MRLYAQALYLAREEMKWSWSSYVLNVSIFLTLGLAAAVSLSSGVSGFEASVIQHQGTEEFYGAFFADYLFLLVCAVDGANMILGYYTLNRRGTFFASRLLFLRSLPISAGALVGGRVLSMLFALVVGAFAFSLCLCSSCRISEKSLG